MSIHWNQEQIDKIIELYTEQQYSIAKIAKRMGCSDTAIRTVLKHNNIAFRTVQQANGTTIHLTEEQIDEILYNYIVLKQGLQTCGKKYGYSQFLVKKLLKERGIQKRNYTEAKQSQRIYEINDNYFKTQSHNMAYILGFIAADGNVSLKENSISIQLHEQDNMLLEEIKKEIGSNRSIDFYITKAGRRTCKLQVWSSEMKQDLANYGIIPNKTLVLKSPTLLDPKYHIDYIRGYFDGDGTVYIKEGHRKIVSFVGASKEVMTWIRDVLNQHNITTPSFRSSLTEYGTTIYTLTYFNQSTVKKIENLFYDSNNSLYLKRKRDIFSQETSLPQTRAEKIC